MKKAQQEVKSTVTVNMSDIGNKPREDKDSPEHCNKGIWAVKNSVHQSMTRKVIPSFPMLFWIRASRLKWKD